MVDPFANQAADPNATQNQSQAGNNTSFSADDVFGGNEEAFAAMQPQAFQPLDPETGEPIDHNQETLNPFLVNSETEL